MKKFFPLLFILLNTIQVEAQLTFEDKFELSIEEGQSYLSIFTDVEDVKIECPPNLGSIKDNRSGFVIHLDSLLKQNLSDSLFFLTRLLSNNCQAYYSLLLLEEHFSRQYAKQFKEESIQDYITIPSIVSFANPSLQIEGDKAGMWQLSFVNAKRYGLRIDNIIDERFDIERSTDAALKYLYFLENFFDGNKLYAITAFNSSVAYVNKVKTRLDTESDEAFISALPKDQLYFLHFYLSWYTWKVNFKKYKVDDSISKSLKQTKALIVKDSIKIEILTEFLGLNQSIVRKMNPTWVGEIITAETSRYPFYLAKEKTEFIEDHYDGFMRYQNEKLTLKKEELNALKKKMKDDIPDPKKYKAVTYKVKSGDVLGLIAQRYSVKVSSIKKWNKLSSDRINVGQELTLYVAKSKNIDLPEEKEEEQIEVKAKEPKVGKGTYTTYKVQSGESLWLIARKFPGISAENIMEWNGISDKIKPGQSLKIYQAD